jgi:hypothetical protein
MLKSDRTCAEIVRDPTCWTNLKTPINKRAIGPYELTLIDAGKLSVSNTAKAGVILEGLIYNEKSNAHITITPWSDGTWSYFHLTLVGGDGGAAYFVLDENEDGELVVKTTTDTVFEGVSKSVSKATHTVGLGEAVSDLTAIMRGLIGNHFSDV